MLARPTRQATYHRTLESGELRCSERRGMLIGDPLGEGEALLALPITSSGSKGAGMLIGTL